MNNKHTCFVALLLVFTMAFFSCAKIKETLERDIIVSPEDVEFNIPIITSTESGRPLGELAVTMDFDSLINAQTKDLGVNNATSFKVTSIKLNLDSLDDENNFGNFENISIYIQSASEPKIEIGKLEANPNSKTRSVTIPIIAANPELKKFLVNSSFKFILEGKARKPTTVILNAQATLTYSLTVGK